MSGRNERTAASAAGSRLVLPPWVVLHLPHTSAVIPEAVEDQFLLVGEDLRHEHAALTDHHANELFCAPIGSPPVVRARASRIVVDVERFVDDAREPAARLGFGAICTRTTNGRKLRRWLSRRERAALLRRHAAHHARLARAIDEALAAHGRCLVLDCHTFSNWPAAFEVVDRDTLLDLTQLDVTRPDICIGTDPMHTPPALAQCFVEQFTAAGFHVAMNRPFAGALVPAPHYAADSRVHAIMVDVNQRVCRDPEGPMQTACHPIAYRVRECCTRAVASFTVMQGADTPVAAPEPAAAVVTTFAVDESGVLRPTSFVAPKTRREAYGPQVRGWSDSPRALARILDDLEPLAWPVRPVYEQVRDALEEEIDWLKTKISPLWARIEFGGSSDEMGRFAEMYERQEACEALLATMPHDAEDGVFHWLLRCDELLFRVQVVPRVEQWLEEEPSDFELEQYLGPERGQQAAVDLFRGLDSGAREALGIVVADDMPPGSGRGAIELHGSVEQANAAAAAAGIAMRFVAAWP
jgi:N-formylglutamate amidohydrolase